MGKYIKSYNFSSDIWSVGVVFLEMLLDKPVFSFTLPEVISEIVHTCGRMSFLEEFENDACVMSIFKDFELMELVTDGKPKLGVTIKRTLPPMGEFVEVIVKFVSKMLCWGDLVRTEEEILQYSFDRVSAGELLKDSIFDSQVGEY